MNAPDIPIWVRTAEGLAFSDVPERPGGRMPDFCIIGSAKCGTTSLDRYLGRHPDIFVCALKEPQYFSTRVMLARGAQWYRGLYAEARPDQVCGEASTSYTRYPLVAGTAERMHAANPAMKLIYVVRDPVQRVESEALQAMKYLQNVLGEDYRDMTLDSFLEMVEDPASPHHSAIVETSRYEQQVRAFERVFPAEQILILTQSELRTRAGEVMARLHAFLGVTPDPSIDASDKRNVTADFFEGTARARVTSRLGRVPGYRLMRRLLPAGVKTRIVKALAPAGSARTLKLSPQMRQRIEADLAEDTAAFEARLGQPWREW